MTNDRSVLEKLLKIAENQQKIIMKLAQNYQAPANNLEPNQAVHRSLNDDAIVILHALPPAAKVAVKDLTVHSSTEPGFDGEVRVIFQPNRGSDEAFKAVQNTVQKLQTSNLLQGKSYIVKEVA